jgi:hypothetical protein
MLICEKNRQTLKMFNFISNKNYSTESTKIGSRSRWYGIIETQKMVSHNGNTCFGNMYYGVMKLPGLLLITNGIQIMN